MSTVGVEWSDRRADLATRHRVTFLGAAVSGSSRPAENGQLVVLASGPRSARSRLEPIFEPLARQIIWLDHVGDGSRLKLRAQQLALGTGRRNGRNPRPLPAPSALDPHLFVSTVAGGPLASPYATEKPTAMVNTDFTPGFPLQHAAKDAALAAEAAHRRGLELPLTAALLDRWHQAIAAGHGHGHVASTITAGNTVPAATGCVG